MALSGLAWLRNKQRAAESMMRDFRFAKDRRSSTSVEFAIVGLIYFTILFFVIQGGIFYIKVTVLDFATEAASRTVLLNQNPATTVATPPTTGTAFATLVAQHSFGVLQAANLKVALQIVPPRSVSFNSLQGYQGNATSGAAGTYGFTTITPFTFAAGQTAPYQYTNPGVCPVNYETQVADNGATASFLNGIAPTNGTITACTGTCLNAGYAAANGNNGQTVIIGGIADDGSSSISTSTGGGHTFTNTVYTDGTYTCYAGQDALLQVQYIDPTLTLLVGKYFGSVVSSLAFQIEPFPQ
jgi:Flp pilus assembly protein TadG